jgi:tRNA A37 threonylcarbamoyladenosine synthetase subunit TsaC/SUA5/YrdC
MDDNLHLKNCERSTFEVAKFPNRITKLIHQMWDGMVTMIVIKKNNKMAITFEATKIDVEGSLVIKVPKKT